MPKERLLALALHQGQSSHPLDLQDQQMGLGRSTPDVQKPFNPHNGLDRVTPAQQQQEQPEKQQPHPQELLDKVSIDQQQQQQQDPAPGKPAAGEQLEGRSFTARTTLNLDTAMSLYGLTDSQSFWEVQQDTNCLMGWGNNTVVVSFRGTASMKNALADLQVTAHISISCMTFPSLMKPAA